MNTLSSAFTFASRMALLGWLVLFAYPLWPQFARVLVFTIVVALLCALYVGFVFFAKYLDDPGARAKGNFFSLAGVISLFKSPRVVLAGWIHYLAFDLMVGLYIVIDASRLGIAHWWLMPALFLTLMFGPAGLLLYLAMRVAMAQGEWAITGF